MAEYAVTKIRKHFDFESHRAFLEDTCRCIAERDKAFPRPETPEALAHVRAWIKDLPIEYLEVLDRLAAGRPLDGLLTENHKSISDTEPSSAILADILYARQQKKKSKYQLTDPAKGLLYARDTRMIKGVYGLRAPETLTPEADAAYTKEVLSEYDAAIEAERALRRAAHDARLTDRKTLLDSSAVPEEREALSAAFEREDREYAAIEKMTDELLVLERQLIVAGTKYRDGYTLNDGELAAQNALLDSYKDKKKALSVLVSGLLKDVEREAASSEEAVKEDAEERRTFLRKIGITPLDRVNEETRARMEAELTELPQEIKDAAAAITVTEAEIEEETEEVLKEATQEEKETDEIKETVEAEETVEIEAKEKSEPADTAVDVEVPAKETTEDVTARRRMDLAKEHGIVIHQKETAEERRARLEPLREAMREEREAMRDRELQGVRSESATDREITRSEPT